MAGEATTPTGAAQEKPAVPNLNEATRYSRADAMKAMSERRREKVVEEMTPEDAAAYKAGAPEPKVDDEDSDTREPAPTQEQEPARPAPQPELDPVKQVRAITTLADADLGNYKVKVRINGVEQEMTLDAVRAEAQKTGAADQYLRQASEALERIKALETQQKTEAPETPKPEAKQDDPGFAKAVDDFTTRMFQGDEAGAKQALTEALERLRPTQTTPNVDVAQLTRQVKYEYAIDEARNRFASARPSVLVDHSLAQTVANQCIADELATRNVKSFYELPIGQIGHAFEAAGRRMDGFAPGEVKAAPDVDPARGTKKAAIDELPHASVRAASTVPEPQSVSDKIAAMRAARPGTRPV